MGGLKKGKGSSKGKSGKGKDGKSCNPKRTNSHQVSICPHVNLQSRTPSDGQ